MPRGKLRVARAIADDARATTAILNSAENSHVNRQTGRVIGSHASAPVLAAFGRKAFDCHLTHLQADITSHIWGPEVGWEAQLGASVDCRTVGAIRRWPGYHVRGSSAKFGAHTKSSFVPRPLLVHLTGWTRSCTPRILDCSIMRFFIGRLP